MTKHQKFSTLIVSGAILLGLGTAAISSFACLSVFLFLRGPKDPEKAERELAKRFEEKPEVFERLVAIAREDQKRFEGSITIKKRGGEALGLPVERVREYRTLMSALDAQRIRIGSWGEILAIKIDFHSWGYSDTYQVVGWYFGESLVRGGLFLETVPVDSISTPYRHPKGYPTASLQSAGESWWYFLESGG
jgi:hypothetical protein